MMQRLALVAIDYFDVFAFNCCLVHQGGFLGLQILGV